MNRLIVSRYFPSSNFHVLASDIGDCSKMSTNTLFISNLSQTVPSAYLPILM